MRLRTVHHDGKLSLGIDEVELGHQPLIVLQALVMLADSAAEQLEYPYDLRVFVQLKLPELVVESYHSLRFHEKSCPRG